MATPQSTPLRHAKLGISSNKSLPLVNEYKKLLNDQHQRLTIKHQQDLELLDDIRGYVKARLSIEREYTSALGKLAKHHTNHINKKFALLSQCDEIKQGTTCMNEDYVDHNDEQLRKRLTAGNGKNTGGVGGGTNIVVSSCVTGSNGRGGGSGGDGQEPPEKPFSLYRVWAEHIQRLQATTKNRVDQFEQLILTVDKLKDIRSHKANIGKKCLDTHLKRIHEDIMVSMVELEKAKKLYNEDESQAKKARENEEKIKKKRSGLLTKFSDLQAKKERTSAQREATDIQSTQARNDYIMALAAANAHLQQYYQRDLNDFIHLIDDGVLDHCKVFMATLSECDINSLKDNLCHAQYWSRLINWTGSQQTNSIFLTSEQSACLRAKSELKFEPCNNDPIHGISLEHNADYALQHEIDKWFTWFKKECRNLSQLMHQLDTCQHALAEGKRSIELNGQNVEDLEPKIIELKQQIRKCEATKLKAQARLKVIKEGGMQIEEWSTIESEIRADMAKAQEELRAKRLREKAQEQQLVQQQQRQVDSSVDQSESDKKQQNEPSIHLQVSRDSDMDESDIGADGVDSIHNLASVSRSTSNLLQKQQNALSGYSALTDPSLVWQDDYSNAWGSNGPGANQMPVNQNVVVTDILNSGARLPASPRLSPSQGFEGESTILTAKDQVCNNNYDLLSTSKKQHQHALGGAAANGAALASVSIQSSSPLSAIVNGQHNLTSSPYQGMMSEAYKSDYECDYNRNGHMMGSAASSAEPSNAGHHQQYLGGKSSAPNDTNDFVEEGDDGKNEYNGDHQQLVPDIDVSKLLNRRVLALYNFEKNNEDDLSFNESDVLFVIELIEDDPNWLKARNETTGEQGYIPASYVRLIENERLGQLNKPGDVASRLDSASASHEFHDDDNAWVVDTETTVQDATDFQPSDQFCRALYDYKPEENTFEEDGLPHLTLVQGELIRIIDQGEDDGWWLVEKTDSSKTRGHVPSMLVEEVEPCDEIDGEMIDEDDDGSASELDAEDENQAPPPSMMPPTIEPPTLNEDDGIDKQIVISFSEDQENRIVEHDVDENNNNIQAEVPKDDDTQYVNEDQENDESTADTQNSNSLIPTSFIIIEPTPEVETKRFEDGIKSRDAQHDSTGSDEGVGHVESREQDELNRRVIQSKPPTVSYSVVNDNFVLERPSRKPHQSTSTASSGTNNNPSLPVSHETILEENINEETTSAPSQNDGVSAHADGEMVSRVNDADMPLPPSVIVESFDEHLQRQSTDSVDEQTERENYLIDRGDTNADNKQTGPTVQHVESQDEIDSTQDPFDDANVEISTILCTEADEISKQIIDEALMLAPGASIGPSTSAAHLNEIDHDEAGEDCANTSA